MGDRRRKAFDGAVDISWLDRADPDRRDLDGVAAIIEASREADYPQELARTVPVLRAGLRHGWSSTPIHTAVARQGHRVVGVLEMELPAWDNTHTGNTEINVDPLLRRRGIGTRLFAEATDRMRRENRTLILAESWDLPASSGFCKAMGLERASEEIQRRQDVVALDWNRLGVLYAGAEAKAAGYELVRIPGDVPEDLMPAIVELTAAINDAPTDDLQIEDEKFSPERLRAAEVAQVAAGRRQYRLVARERATGVLAGHTVLAVDVDHPWHGWQYDTSVLRTHRGHRLGLLLKIGMMRWLQDAEPQLRAVNTWNAGSNDHMIAVNELLGFRIVASATAWQRKLA
jgi:GNAT superfamily N-acetyltransferase/RimJ/RimL family protein N-acetyltransferase